jgi:hypothetical protein
MKLEEVLPFLREGKIITAGQIKLKRIKNLFYHPDKQICYPFVLLVSDLDRNDWEVEDEQKPQQADPSTA